MPHAGAERVRAGAWHRWMVSCPILVGGAGRPKPIITVTSMFVLKHV